MSDTTPEIPAPEMSADDILVRLDAVIVSIVNTGRADLAALRSLPRWRAVQVARVAFKAGAITRADLDAITRETAVLGALKPAKPQKASKR
jgi:hypothetical protein